MDDRPVAEQAAELARTLPASSTLTADRGFRRDDVAYLLNDEPISKELYDALVPIFAAARQRSMHDPRWVWVDVSTGASHPKQYVKGRCRHIELEPVSGVDADMLFRCGTCGKYLQTVRR
jgi:hypothetical protein